MVSSMTLEDRIAAALARKDIEAAATEAIKGYAPQILGYLRAVIRDVEDADEVFSQFAEDLWKGLAGFRGECSVRVWAYKLAWHAASRFGRDPYRRRRERLPSTFASRLAETFMSSPGSALERRSAEVQRLRQHLSDVEQTLLVLRVDRQLSWREVAEVMADEGEPVDEGTLRKRYERVKTKLARLAKDEGLIGRS
jgi:RNA polymerase sigma-70 factor (ECF subfamily)